MNCDVSKVESIKERINKARAFKEPHKSHLKQSYTPWCTGCRQQYKDSTCDKVKNEGKRIREWNDNIDYKDNIKNIGLMCKKILTDINSLPSKLRNMDLDTLELLKTEHDNNVNKITKSLKQCFDDRVAYSKNCIFNNTTNSPSTDKGHSNVENELLTSYKYCKSVDDITHYKHSWEDEISKVYKHKYPTNNKYGTPRSQRKSLRKSSRNSKKKSSRNSKKVGKNRYQRKTKK